jgi:general secretion pathway protein I
MRKGFTLLEVLVATLIMGLAVTGMMTALSTSMRNAARLTDHDRMAMLARARMDELLVDRTLPLEAEFDGGFDPQVTGGEQAGYHVAMSVFEAPPQTPPLTPVLQRIVLHVWWKQGEKQHGFDLEAFRRSVIPAAPL